MAKPKPPCDVVRVRCRRGLIALPMYSEVSSGFEFSVAGNECSIILSRPDPCILVPETSVHYSEWVDYRVTEFETNVLVEIFKGSSKTKSFYVFPKDVWRRIFERYIGPLSKGDPPPTPGIILYGAEGTGKSSLAKIVAELSGFPFFTIDPHSVLSKWVGDTEKKLKSMFRRAISSAPSIIIINEGEWLLSERSFSTQYDTTHVYHTMKTVMLELMDELWYGSHPVLVVATTNAPPSVIDKAHRRPGRFDSPILISLPDLEAIRIVMRYMGVPQDLIEVYSYRLLSWGVSMSDVVKASRDLIEGKDPEVRKQARGYYRSAIRSVSKDIHSTFESSLLAKLLPCEVLSSSRARLHVPMNIAVGEPLVVSFSTLICRTPGIVVVDERFIDEAMQTASVGKSYLIVDTDTASRDLQMHVGKSAETPVVYVGSSPSAYPSIKIPVSIENPGVPLHHLVEVALRYYGVSISDGERRIIRAIASQNASRVREFLVKARHYAIDGIGLERLYSRLYHF